MLILVLLFKSSTVIKKTFFSILTIALLSFAIHKYYVSITEAEYNTKTETFEISIKFIGHDLEKALATAGAPELFLGTPKEIEKADVYLKEYIEDHLSMVVDGKQLTYRFVGKEVNNDDFIYCFLESNKIEKPIEITIKNSLLVEVFHEQANTVYIKVGDQKLSYALNKEKVSETHQLK